MKSILLTILLSQIITSGYAQKSNDQDFDLTEHELINRLENMDPEVRQECADKIKTLLANNEFEIKEGNVIEYSSEYWLDKFNKYKTSIKKEKFEEEFFKEKIDYVPNYSNVKFYQLDNIHLLRVEVFKKKVELKELTISPLFFPLDPYDNYTGVWKTYYVTGSVNSEAEYLNGVKDGIEILYDWIGDKSWLKKYEYGKVINLYSFDDGEIVEENLKLLEIEGENK